MVVECSENVNIQEKFSVDFVINSKLASNQVYLVRNFLNGFVRL